MIKLSLNRPVTVFMVVAALGVFGYVSYTRLGRDLLPDIAYPSLTVMTDYEGAAPQEVEEFITKRLESALATVRGKRKITSVSREGVSLITIEFDWGEDMQIATLNVREKLDGARFQQGFPEDADRPNILRWDPSSKPIVGLAITAPGTLVQLRDGVQELIKPRLEQLDGVALAQLSGEVERVFEIEVNRDKLVLYNLTLGDISNAVKQGNATIAGGSIKKGRYRYSLRTLGEYSSDLEIGEVVVARRGGTLIRVKDVAEIIDTIKDRESMTFVNGNEAVGLLIYKESGANTIEVTRKIKKVIEALNSEFSNYNVTLAFEDAKFIEQALNNVWISILFGGFFALLVLILFLGDLKSPFFIFTSIPIALISTLVLMYFFDLTLNLMSLGGLALGIGMLVDNSIVVLENIYRHRAGGKSPLQSAYLGTKEVAAPVAASTFTTIAVFFPIVYLKGIAGELFGEQALTVTFSLLSSLFVSLTVLPVLTALSEIVRGKNKPGVQLDSLVEIEKNMTPREFWYWRWWEWVAVFTLTVFVASYFKIVWKWIWVMGLGITLFPLAFFLIKWALTFVFSFLFQAIALFFGSLIHGVQLFIDQIVLPVFNFGYNSFYKVYHRVLIWCLDNKLTTLLIAFIILMLSFYGATELKMELMPHSATGQFSAEIRMLPGTAIEVTAAVAKECEEFLMHDPAVDLVFTQVGENDADLADLLKESGTHRAVLNIKLNDDHISLDEVRRIGSELRKFTGKFHKLQLSFTESESSFEDLLASEGGSGLVIRIESETFESLEEANRLVLEKIRPLKGLKDMKTTFAKDFPQMRISLNRTRISRYGFNIQEVGGFLAGGMRGDVATEFKEFDKKIDVRVRFSERDREEFDKVLRTTLTSPDGSVVPLSRLLDVRMVKSLREILRFNQKRVAMISADLDGVKISEMVPQVEDILKQIQYPKGVSRPVISGEQEGIRNSFSQLGFALLLSIILVYMIMAGQFESFKHPFIVILTVPMGLVGTVFMLYTFDLTLNIMSIIGLIVLSGIVVNDAIVKIDFINQALEGGIDLRSAILQASQVRLRPILMTTATTVLGLLPMATGMLTSLVHLPVLSGLVHWLDGLMLEHHMRTVTELFNGQGAEIQRPLALVVIGGLTCATLMTLILIPVFYELFTKDPGTRNVLVTGEHPEKAGSKEDDENSGDRSDSEVSASSEPTMQVRTEDRAGDDRDE
jgi:HAE1 family hydrophobic/amphiphilic exporter-1